MARISEQEITEIRQRADIVDIISRYVPVEHKGRQYKAVCPFHNDHRPSMTINKEKQFYKCFVCGEGGSVFTFVKNYEKISFTEAVVKVADLIGYTLSERPASYSYQEDPEKKRLYDALADMVQFTMYQMDLPAAAAKKKYLEDRGLDQEVRKHFGIGYNPPVDAVYRFLHAKGHSDRTLNEANIVSFTDSGVIDVFRDRITFPIHDSFGHVIGFSARTINPDVPSKYINTTETPVYIKGNTVYNSHRARLTARRDGKIYICEGVTDVIAFYRAGMENAVCTLGTACTTQQIELIRSLAPTAVFCYDGDGPGQAATLKAGRMARAAGMDVRVVRNKTGLDPDEIIRSQGKEALQNLAGQEISWVEFLIDYLSADTNLQSYLSRKELIRKAQEEAGALDDVDRSFFLGEISRLTGMKVEASSPPPRTEPSESAAPAYNRIVSGRISAEDQILILMMRFARAADRFEKELGYLNDPMRQDLAFMILSLLHEDGTVDPQKLLDRSEEQSISNLITDLMSARMFWEPYDDRVMDGLIRKVKMTVLARRSDQLKEMAEAALNEESRNILYNEYITNLVEMRRYIDDESNN
jgi:DNA primase